MVESGKDGDAVLSEDQLNDLVIESDAGARKPSSRFASYLLLGTAFFWALFQIWIASPLQFELVPWLNSVGITFISVLNDSQSRSIHLAFAVFLAFLAYPAFKNSPRKRIPIIDWALAIIGALCAAYYFMAYEELSNRSGLPTQTDVIVAVTGILLLLEATRRSLGPPLLIIASVFLIYTLFGDSQFVPDLIRHKGQSFSKIASHQWLTTEGVYGIALGVSTSFVFLFVLFGALLDKAGAGNYFIKVAFSLLGHLRGGPAKAAVLSSGMTGLISGSSIANTVTTGTFTIPLMKRVGFSGEKAGAVEVAASVNGQIMPPVMGAAAFLMVEYVGIPYIEVIKHAFLPAVISYIALLYMVHLEALKANMSGLEKPINRTLKQSVLVYGITITSLLVVASVSYHAVQWIKPMFGDHATLAFSLIIFAIYIKAIWYASLYPDLERDDPNAPVVSLPRTAETIKTGIHYLLPIIVLVWCLMIERLSPGLSAYWAVLLMMFILVTQPIFKAFFRKQGELKASLKAGFYDLFDGMVSGSRNMIGIGVATAAAGIIVGTVSLTGVGQVLTEVVEVLSGGSLILVLVLTAIICLILGMGLPTTANYIVVASLMAQVVQELGAQNGLFVPMIAIHLFVFYFGIMADVTPPVGLASFAAAAISGSDPIKTGLQAFAYSLRTAALPFFFIFNTEIIMIGVDDIWHGAWIFLYSTVAILLFSAAAQGFFITFNRKIETVILLLVAVTIFVPKMWMNFISPPFESKDHRQIVQVVENIPVGEVLKVAFRGEDIDSGKLKDFNTYVKINSGGTGLERLESYGIMVSEAGDKIIVDDVVFNSAAEKAGFDYDYEITGLQLKKEQPNPKWMYIPAILLLIFVIFSQTSRKRKELAIAKV